MPKKTKRVYSRRDRELLERLERIYMQLHAQRRDMVVLLPWMALSAMIGHGWATEHTEYIDAKSHPGFIRIKRGGVRLTRLGEREVAEFARRRREKRPRG